MCGADHLRAGRRRQPAHRGRHRLHSSTAPGDDPGSATRIALPHPDSPAPAFRESVESVRRTWRDAGSRSCSRLLVRRIHSSSRARRRRRRPPTADITAGWAATARVPRCCARPGWSIDGKLWFDRAVARAEARLRAGVTPSPMISRQRRNRGGPSSGALAGPRMVVFRVLRLRAPSSSSARSWATWWTWSIATRNCRGAAARGPRVHRSGCRPADRWRHDRGGRRGLDGRPRRLRHRLGGAGDATGASWRGEPQGSPSCAVC